MANKRIIQLPTAADLQAGDQVAIDSTADGTRKFDIGAELAAIESDIADISKYDDLLKVIKITDATTTMGDIETLLNTVNTAGDHVVFDVSALDAGMYLVTIYIGDGYYRIADLVTGFEGTGFFANTDTLIDKIKGGKTTGHHYTFVWDKVNAKGTRLNDAANITLTTTNFGHFGAVNANYDNPFDSIYPWSERKLCNIDIDLYRGLQSGDDITDCVVAWEDDANFDYAHQYGVWVYTPPFFGRSYELGNYRYFDVTDEALLNNIAYPASIQGRWHGADVTLTIDGTSKHCNLPVLGLSMANIRIDTQHTYAKNWGATLTDIFSIDPSYLLMVVEYASMNCQTAIGNGATSVYAQTLHPSAGATNSKTITLSGLTAAQLANFVVGAVIDLGTSDGGNQTARTWLEAVSTSGSVTTLTLHDAVTVTTSTFVSVHGLINLADADIGSHSGYIGANGRCNAYYRGEVLWGNKWQYVLGAYRQTGTGKIWQCAKDDDSDLYDALNTAKHIDTGIVLPTTSNYIQTLAMADGLSIPPYCSAIGGNSTNPVGDYCYVPALTAVNTILLLGGSANSGASAGAFYGYWNLASSPSAWTYGSRPRLKHP